MSKKLEQPKWLGIDSALADAVRQQTRDCLAVYAKDDKRVDEDLATEIATALGGYGRKQLYELVQNGADALLGHTGRIEIVLTPHALYVANEGRELSREGIHGLMAARLSVKRSEEIGRFGLGFKSVIAVSDKPQIFSRSVSLAFDRDWAARTISDVVPGRTHYPLLRVAEPLDAASWAESDEMLADLMSWASTVVRLPLKSGGDAYQLLAEDLRAFPAEFVLFCPHVARLTLRDTGADASREVTLKRRKDGSLELGDSGDVSVWKVVDAEHQPSDDAAADAGELAHRDLIRLQWAVPLRGRARDGEFWAFFPTEFRTTLAGIVNAPWKLGDDRISLLDGAFNRELLTEVLPALVAETLPALVEDDDPTAALDVLPARGRESRNWADAAINAPIFDALSGQPSLPDCTGTFRPPTGLRIHPKNLSPRALSLWAAATPDPEHWVHHGVDRTAERRLKADRIMRADISTSAATWIESLCPEPTVEASAAAVAVVAAVVDECPELAREARASRVLLLEDGELVAPTSGSVFVRSGPEETDYRFIEPAILQVAGVREALDTLGVSVLDRSGELRHALTQVARVDWGRVWTLARAVPTEVAERIMRECVDEPLVTNVQVRTASGGYTSLDRAFLGGGVIPVDGQRDRDHLIDPRFHGADEGLLTRLGAVNRPIAMADPPEERWLRSYKESCVDQFLAKIPGNKPSPDKIVVEGPTPPWPLGVLPAMSPEGAQAMTDLVLGMDRGEQWTIRHATNSAIKRNTAPAPTTLHLRRYGRLSTCFGPWRIDQCIDPDGGWPTDVLPVPAVTTSQAGRLSLLGDPQELSDESWQRMLAMAGAWPDAERRYRLFGWAVHYVQPPSTVRVVVNDRTVDLPPDRVAASCDRDEFRSLLEQRVPVVLAETPEDKAALIENWGLDDGTRMLQQEVVADPAGAPEGILDRFPTLRAHLDAGQADLEIVPCRSINLVVATPGGQVSRPITSLQQDRQVLVTGDEPEVVLAQVSDALHLDLTRDDIRDVLARQRENEASEVAEQIRTATGIPAKLAAAVGADELRQAVPQAALEAVEAERRRPLTDQELAEMAMAVHGHGVLRFFSTVLEARGLNPPQTWAGRSGARRWVAGLGFPVEFAGHPADRREAVLEVEGPGPLPPLHDYQVSVTERIKLLLRGEGPGRGMVALPTGAGKTRVAVQALVEEVRDGRLTGPVVWIAQSDELCEQAVQTWAYVWRCIGPQAPMVVSRFWAGNSVEEFPDTFQLVVATIDKLRNAVGRTDLAWLSEAPLVIIDEAHTSVASSYTQVLEWLGRGRSRKERRPLIGLTATPFRGVNVVETDRLAARYDRNRLDEGAFDGDPYAVLQGRRILAKVRQEMVPGIDIELTAADIDEIRRMLQLPAAVEGRLGANVERNRRIVESISQLPDDWTALLFATTVENARALAAHLTVRGIPAVSISAQTEPAARRRYIEQFKSGDIRVITNFNVLSQGFDAPAVRAVYVTRPTFSANLYQQMIGRGLRGPLNGGSEEVLIVNVEDNFTNFGDQLAFRHFENLWSAR
jgi:superfamily II DNA or RNA helicase